MKIAFKNIPFCILSLYPSIAMACSQGCTTSFGKSMQFLIASVLLAYAFIEIVLIPFWFLKYEDEDDNENYNIFIIALCPIAILLAGILGAIFIHIIIIGIAAVLIFFNYIICGFISGSIRYSDKTKKRQVVKVLTIIDIIIDVIFVGFIISLYSSWMNIIHDYGFYLLIIPGIMLVKFILLLKMNKMVSNTPTDDAMPS